MKPSEIITITIPTPNDILGIRTVWYEAWLDTYPNETLGITIEDIKERFEDYFTPESLEEGREDLRNIPSNHIFLIAKQEGEVVGFCRVATGEEKNQLRGLYISPSFQKRGIGRRLWEEAKKSLDLDIPTHVHLADYNDGARIFYEKMGFSDTGKRWSNPKLTLKSGVIVPEMEMILEPK